MVEPRDNLKLIARLANLELSSHEFRQLQKEFTDILAFVDELKKVAVAEAAPTAQVTDLENVYRPDDVTPFVHHHLLLDEPRVTETKLFRAPAVFNRNDQAHDSAS